MDKLGKVLDVLIVVLLVIGVGFRIFFTPVVVDGSSMFPTLENGDYLVLEKGSKNVSRGDIVAVYSDTLEKTLIKRVIAIEGDTIKIDGSKIYVNDVLLDESAYIKSDWGCEIEEDTVPSGKVFVLGDNRNNSTDSRVLGYLNIADIKGTYVLKLF